MNLTKKLGLLAFGVALLAFDSPASATTITGPSGESTPTVHAVSAAGHIEIHNSIVNIKCSSTFSGTIESHGAGVTAKMSHNELSMTNCTDEWHLTVSSKGGQEFHYVSPGVVTSTLVGITFHATRAGLTCTYSTGNTDFGTITTGSRARFHLVGSFTRHGGSFLCGGSSAQVTGAYETTQSLFVDP